MVRRLTVGVALAAVASLMLAVPALAGGWAVTTLDRLPAEFRAGETYRIGYTILQHGQTPFASRSTAIKIRSSKGGEVRTFAAAPEGAKGHFVAEVRFPAAGEWTWEVNHDLGTQNLGSVTVLPPAAGDSAGAAQAAQAVTPAKTVAGGLELAALRVALPLLTILAAGLFAVQAIWFVRRVRAAKAADPQPQATRAPSVSR
jgi:hypothetical protein